ncbi:MAG: hypothetical protein EXR71_18445 [Myxococcales bacterium]|nr:hypothetical protein [Myxococcales bacterium]
MLSAIADASSGFIPRWAWGAGFAVLALFLWPLVRRTARIEEARRRFRTATRLTHQARVAQEDSALAHVLDHADGLVALCELAMAEGRPRIVPEALARLRELGKRIPERRRIEAALDGPQPRSALEACILIDTLLAQGVREAAVRRLHDARIRWPEDADLGLLADRLRDRW